VLLPSNIGIKASQLRLNLQEYNPVEAVMQDVSRILNKADKVRRAFGANRGLIIILMALWSARRKPGVIEACIALVSGGVALAAHFLK
jgi:hypothetical protein